MKASNSTWNVPVSPSAHFLFVLSVGLCLPIHKKRPILALAVGSHLIWSVSYGQADHALSTEFIGSSRIEPRMPPAALGKAPLLLLPLGGRPPVSSWPAEHFPSFPGMADGKG